MDENRGGKGVLLSILGVAILVVAVVGVSFAIFSFSQAGTKANTITTGSLSMTYTERSNGISINNMWPIDDNTGKLLEDGTGYCSKANPGGTPYEQTACTTNGGQWVTGDANQVFVFSVTADIAGTATVNYEVTAIKEASTLENNEIKLYLEKSTDNNTYNQELAPSHYVPGLATATGSPADSMVLATGSFTSVGETTVWYKLRMWLDEDYTVVNGAPSENFTVKVNVYGKNAL